MREKSVELIVYGAEQICASCVGAPGSKDTYEWLQAAIGRKYEGNQIQYEYVDIDNPPAEEKHEKFVERIHEEDLFWPLVVINDEIVAEGIPRLKSIYESLEKHGIS